MYTVRLICLILACCLGIELSYSLEVTPATNGRKKVTLNPEDMKKIRESLGIKKREKDIFGKLIPGIFTDPRENKIVELTLSKHHIIPVNMIIEKLKELAAANTFVAGKEDKLKTMFEGYLNHEKNIECQQEFLAWLPTPEKDEEIKPNEVAAIFRDTIIWNPNNLRVGPLANQRSDDPDELVDYALLDPKESEKVRGFVDDTTMNILDQLTSLRSDSNPKWKYIQGEKCPRKKNEKVTDKICPWKVAKDSRAGGITATRLVKKKLPDNNDDPTDVRRFNVESGDIIG